MPFFRKTILWLIMLTFLMGNVLAEQSKKLPNGFKALVPQGYELDSPQLVKSGNMATISFLARKQFEGRHSVYFSEYHFELFLKESSPELIKMQAPMYRTQLEKDIESNRQSYADEKSDPIKGCDPPEVTKYPWGAGITQRIKHHYMGAGKKPDEIEYSCIYLGLITGDRTIKKFKLIVFGVESRQEADQWAKAAVEKIQKTSLHNLEG